MKPEPLTKEKMNVHLGAPKEVREECDNVLIRDVRSAYLGIIEDMDKKSRFAKRHVRVINHSEMEKILKKWLEAVADEEKGDGE